MLRYTTDTLEIGADGQLHAQNLKELSPLSGETVGYRCAVCRWPDTGCAADAFAWQTLEDVQLSGALSLPRPLRGCVRRCMICRPNGEMQPLLVELSHPAPLGTELRARALRLVGAPAGAILLTQGDSGIRAFARCAWKQAPRLTLTPLPQPVEAAPVADL